MNELQMKVLVSQREQQRHRFAFKSLEPIAREIDISMEMDAEILWMRRTNL